MSKKSEKPDTVTPETPTGPLPEPRAVMDAVAADASADEFRTAYRRDIPPEVQKRLKELWAAHYMTSGHKRLARIVLGR